MRVIVAEDEKLYCKGSHSSAIGGGVGLCALDR